MSKRIILFLLMCVCIFPFTIVYAEEVQSMIADEETGEVPSNYSDDIQKESVVEEEKEEEIPTVGADEKEISQYELVIEDDAHLLTDEQQEQLKDKMMSLTKYGHIVFKSISENSMNTADYARNYYHDHFHQDSGTVFLIDMDNRQIYIFSDGDNYQSITNSKAYSITDNVYQYATNGEYYLCAYNAFNQIQTILDGGKIPEPMRYASIFVIALVISFFINFLIVLSHSKIKAANNSKIVKGCNIDFNLGDVHAEKTGTHRVYSPVSDSSSSGGGGSGGGSSGGGGGHSF